MLLVLASTREAFQLIAVLKERGFPLLAVAQSAYGEEMARRAGADETLAGLPGAGEWPALWASRGITAVVDATHPGAVWPDVLQLAGRRSVPYIRLLRPPTSLPASPLVVPVQSWEEAVERAAALGDTIFLTTGSYNLELFLRSPLYRGKRVVVRVLPEYRVVQKCQELGLSPRDIVAMQGPFSRQLNRALLQAYRAEVLVTRDSGGAGGTLAKVNAALGLGIPAVVLRPALPEGVRPAYSVEEVLRLISG